MSLASLLGECREKKDELRTAEFNSRELRYSLVDLVWRFALEAAADPRDLAAMCQLRGIEVAPKRRKDGTLPPWNEYTPIVKLTFGEEKQKTLKRKGGGTTTSTVWSCEPEFLRIAGVLRQLGDHRIKPGDVPTFLRENNGESGLLAKDRERYPVRQRKDPGAEARQAAETLAEHPSGLFTPTGHVTTTKDGFAGLAVWMKPDGRCLVLGNLNLPEEDLCRKIAKLSAADAGAAPTDNVVAFATLAQHREALGLQAAAAADPELPPAAPTKSSRGKSA